MGIMRLWDFRSKIEKCKQFFAAVGFWILEPSQRLYGPGPEEAKDSYRSKAHMGPAPVGHGPYWRRGHRPGSAGARARMSKAHVCPSPVGQGLHGAGPYDPETGMEISREIA